MDKRSIILVLTLCIFCTAYEPAPKKNALIDSVNKCSLKLLKDYSSRSLDSNLIISPLSAWIALSMLAYGARKETFTEIRNSLYLPKSPPNPTAFFEILEKLDGLDQIDLKIANKLFVNEAFKLKNGYQRVINKIFGATVEKLDVSNSKDAADNINNWVSGATNNTIKDLIDESEISSDLYMIILNAVHFKGDWKTKFESENTAPKTFYYCKSGRGHVYEQSSEYQDSTYHCKNDKSQADEKDVPTMSVKSYFINGQLEDLSSSFVQLPYKHKDAKMTIIRPGPNTDINSLLNNISTFDISAIEKNGRNTTLNLSLPKFKINSKIDLNQSLKQLGMKRMYDPISANFTNIAFKQIYVSNVKQKAFIEVNEEGSEAAAATSLGLFVRSEASYTPEFNVNRPSLFLITVNNIVVFTGIIGNPEY